MVAEYNGKRLYFCEKDCLNEFLENPAKFVKSDHCLIALESQE
ncbi:MAG: YHS domain-containing protein [Candidatus Kariarchaeaceae archaeon]